MEDVDASTMARRCEGQVDAETADLCWCCVRGDCGLLRLLVVAAARQVDALAGAGPRSADGVRVVADAGGKRRSGRAYAADGGVYIAASLIWLWSVERMRPDRWDVIGAAICLMGAGVTLFGSRTA